MECLEKNKLAEDSPPTAWVHDMMKINDSYDFHETLISKWTYWTNAKGIMSIIGLDGGYDGGSFFNFNMKEIKQCLGLIILNGLSISPVLNKN